MTPMRIQRKRTKGFRLPENTVCVSRPSKWGNPFRVGRIYGNNAILVAIGVGYHEDGIYIADAEQAVGLYQDYIDWRLLSQDLDIEELRGKNLACFCPLDKPCHVDPLLKRANK